MSLARVQSVFRRNTLHTLINSKLISLMFGVANGLRQVVPCALNTMLYPLFSIRLIQLFSTRATPRVTSPKNISLQKLCFLYGTSHWNRLSPFHSY